MASVEVLNGTVDVGDRIAYGVRDGNCAGIRIGVVAEVIEFPLRRWDYTERGYVPDGTGYNLRVFVEKSSTGTLPRRPVIIGTANVVKL